MADFKVKTDRALYTGDNFNLVLGKNLDTDKKIKMLFHTNDIPFHANLLIHGEIKRDKYGKTLDVQSYEFYFTNSKADIVSLLSSNMFPGIGEKTAQKIADAYEVDLLTMNFDKAIRVHPQILEDIVKYDKAKMIRDVLVDKEAELQLNETFAKYDLNQSILTKMREDYDTSSILRVLGLSKSEKQEKGQLTDNFYEFAFKNSGYNFTFKATDEIVYWLNRPLWEKEHNKWLILGQLRAYFSQTGNTWVTVRKFGNMMLKLIDKKTFETNTNALIKEKLIKLETMNKEKILTFSNFYYKEKENAEIISKNVLVPNHPFKEWEIDNAIADAEKEIGIKYDEAQISAIKMMATNKVMLLQGSAGTGKSKVVQGIVKVYQKLTGNNVALLAPTGKAANRLTEIDPSFVAKTIHSFLNVNPFENEENFLDGDITQSQKTNCGLVVVDEASMLDVFTLNMLLKNITFDRLIFVGDINQLPSVNVGDVLWDMVESNKIPMVYLKTIHRTSGDSGIITLANKIENNEIKNVSDIDGITLVDNKLDTDIEKEIAKKINSLIENNVDLNNYQVLAPMYKTTWGIDKLNNFIQSLYQPKIVGKKRGKETFVLGDKVLFTINSSKTGTANGETGVITLLEMGDANKVNHVVIHSYTQNRDIDLMKSNKKNQENSAEKIFDDLTLGYATSVHKSQGSEYQDVVLVCDTDGNNFLDKRNIYTAVTRSKKALTILGNSSDFIHAVQKQPKKRNTFMENFLKEYVISPEDKARLVFSDLFE